MDWLCYMAAAGFGLIFGSFFNVVIYRLPEDMSLGNRSACPLCGAMIRWYDNVPLLSYAILGGRCRSCKGRISPRYPLIEALSASLFVLVYWWSRGIAPRDLGLPEGQVLTPELFIGLLMVCVLIIVSAVDVRQGIVPNKVMYPGLAAMLILVAAVGIFRGQPGRIGIAAASSAAGGLFLLVVGLLYGRLFLRGSGNAPEGGDALKRGGATGEVTEEDREIPTGIGMGDVKLIAFCGLALGYFHWYSVIVQVVMGFVLGALASIPLLLFTKKGRKDRLQFAPFLATGALIALVWGEQLADLYLKLLR